MKKTCLIESSLRLLGVLILTALLAVFLNACGGGGGDEGGGGGDAEAPTTPTNLTATAVSASRIDLSWDASTDNVGVAGYKIYRDGSLVASSMDLSSSIDSSSVYDKATVDDTDDMEATGYVVFKDGTFVAYVETSPVEPTAIRDTNFTAITDTNYSDTGLNENTQYCYSVSAYDAAGNESGQSSQACATTPEETPCEGGGLPLVISDLDFPSTVTSDSSVLGSVAYQGSFNDIVNPVMAYRVYTDKYTITTYLISAVPTTNNCRIIFTVSIPDEVSGTGTSQFKLVDFDSGGSSNWDDNGVSNVLSKTVTIN